VWLLLVTVVGAGLVVFSTRGNWRALTHLRVTAAWLLGAGLAIQIALEYVAFPKAQIETVGYAFLMVSYGFILAFCLVNSSMRGFGVIAIGIALNALVIGLNQGMPTRPIGANAQGNRIDKPVVQTVKHRQERADDLLGFLGDKILFPRPLDTLVSLGDLVIAVGICELAFFGSRRRNLQPVTTSAVPDP
jgi:Family of unknown function (DUF5317)